MKVGIIAPIRMLDRYCTTSIQYCLARLLVESQEYRDFYLKRRDLGNIIILDSKKVGSWKREPEDSSIIEEALNIIEPDYFILPSWMFNQKRTISAIKAFPWLGDSRIGTQVACLEGTNIEQVEALKETLQSEMDTDSLAIPEHIQTFCKSVECHNAIIYLDNHLRIEELDGLDGILVTSLPVKLGLQGRLLSDYLPSPPSLEFNEEENGFPRVIERNIEELLEYYEL